MSINPADRLIVALDCQPREARSLVSRLMGEAGVSWFKLGVATFIDRRSSDDLIALAHDLSCTANVFLDLKLYDTRDTVDRTVRAAFDLGARFVTVHATPSVMEAAMRAKPAGDYCKVLAVPTLTDYYGLCLYHRPHIEALAVCDGIVCSKPIAAWFRAYAFGSHGADKGKLLICPGIRQVLNDGDYDANQDHWRGSVASPSEALRAGADYVVVGRPIWQAADPVAAAQAVIAEIATVGSTKDGRG